MKSVTTNNFGCPLCRSTLAEVSEEQDDDDELNSYNENYSDGENYSEDIRFDSDLTENHLLRGFRWLFNQHTTEEIEEVPSIFDGNSFAITRNSIRNATTEPSVEEIEPLDDFENDDFEDDEYDEEQEWTKCEKQTRKVQDFSKGLVDDILFKRIPYKKLLSAYLCNKFPDLFDFIEFQHDDDKVFSILEEKVKILANEIKEEESREIV